jgi:hypothetical protein
MAIRVSVLSALFFKPVALARDLCIVAIFGLGTITDSYYATLTALSLAPGVVIGALGNHWIPRYSSLSDLEREHFFFLTLTQSIRLGIWISAVVAILLVVLIPQSLTLGRVTTGFLVSLSLLTPTVPLLFITAWIGNKFLADSRPIGAQVVFASHTVCMLAILLFVELFSAAPQAESLIYYHLIAQLISTTIVGFTQLQPFLQWRRQEVRPRLDASGLRWTAYAVSISEALAYGALQTALIVLPGNIIVGAGALGGIIARLYSATLSLVVTPASQGMLLQLTSERTSTTVLKNIKKIAIVVFLLSLAGPLLVTPLANILPIWSADIHATLAVDFVVAFSIQFAAFGLIIVSSRILAVFRLPYQCSAYLCFGYIVSILAMYCIHPASNPVNYALVSSCILLIFGVALAAFSYYLLMRR